MVFYDCTLGRKITPRDSHKEVKTNALSKQILNMYLEETDLVDIWRHQHENDRQFTYHAKYQGQLLFTRLDYFLVSFGLSGLIKKYIDRSLNY